MPRLPRVTGAEVLAALKRDGWDVDHVTGSHHLMRHPDKPGRPNVPVHAGQDVHPKTLRSILREAGMTADDLRVLL